MLIIRAINIKISERERLRDMFPRLLFDDNKKQQNHEYEYYVYTSPHAFSKEAEVALKLSFTDDQLRVFDSEVKLGNN